MASKTPRGFNQTQNNAMEARAFLETVRAAVKADYASIPMPADYDTNDEIAEIYEMALMDIEAKHGLESAKALARVAEELLLDWSAEQTRKIASAEQLAEIEPTILRARENPRFRERLIDIALRLAA
jgi:hypothetical protein